MRGHLLPGRCLPWPSAWNTFLGEGAQGILCLLVQLGRHAIADLERYRDDCLLAVQAAVRATKLKHGISLDE